MKHKLLPLIFCASLSAAAQTQVSGTLVDSLNHSGEPYATVRLLSPKGAVLTSFLTDENGNFSKLLTGKGPHLLSFSAVGRRTMVKPIELGSATLQLDTLLISSSETLLQAATITAQKALVKMETDKITYDTENDADAKSFTLLDMLRKVPLVIVDGRDNITVNGSSSFLVYVDGKPNPMFQSNPSQVMKSIPASFVKKIEVQTHPGARFDAEGVGGVINLITQSTEGDSQLELTGYDGNIASQVSTTHFESDAFLSLQKKKLTLTFNAVHNASQLSDMSIETVRQQQVTSGTNNVSSNTSQRQRQYYTSFSSTVAYQLNKENLFSVSFGLNRFAERSNMYQQEHLFGGDYGSGFNYLTFRGIRNNDWTGHISTDYQHNSKKKEGRLFTISYRMNFSPSNSRVNTDFDGMVSGFYDLTNRYSDGRNRTTQHIAQLDYTTPVGKGHKISTGFKFTARNNHARTNFFLADAMGNFSYNVQGSSNYKELSQIGAVYAEYEGALKTLTLKAGLRYEHTWAKEKFLLGTSPNFSLDYGNLVPNVTISWSLKSGQNLGVSFSQRISRPGLTYLNPSVDLSSPLARSYGNVNLDAERHNKISLVYNFFSSFIYLNAQLSHHFTSNGISEYSFFNGNVLNTTYGNVVRSRTEEFSSFINVNLAKNTRIYTNLSGSYVDLRSEALGSRNHGWSGMMMLGVQQTLPWKLKISANFFANSRQHTLQSRSGNSFTGAYATLSRAFFKDKLDVSVFGFSPLDNKLRINTENWGHDFSQSTKVTIPIRVVGIRIAYSFGNRKIETPKNTRTIEETDILEKGKGTSIPTGVMN